MFMVLTDWLGLILTTLSIVALSASAVKKYIDAKFQPIENTIQEIRSETKTNGGTSMRDEIKFIKKDNEEAKKIREEQKEKLDHMYDILLEYIAKNKN
jgi:hypothetical protein